MLKTSKFLFFITTLLIIFGIIIRIVVFNNFSYFLSMDECHSLLKIKESFVYILTTYVEGANFLPGYKIILKILYKIFGFNWFIFKIPSLIAGIASVFLFLSLCLKAFKNKYLVIPALLILSLSCSLIYYCSNIKPYTFDILFTLMIINSAINLQFKGVEKFLTKTKLFYYIPILLNSCNSSI